MKNLGMLKAVVKEGRLVLNEPTKLPEGTVMELRPVSALDELRRQLEDEEDLLVTEVDPDDPSAEGRVVNLADEMEPEELDRFRASLEVSVAEAAAGQLIPAEEVLERLRNKK